MMDKEYFMNATMPISWTEEQQSFLNSSSSSMDHFSHFDSALSSMVSSPAAAATSNDAFAIRELIGKLGGGVRSYPPPASPYIGTHNNNNNNNDSCYNTPLSSSPPLKLNLPIVVDHHINNMPNFVNSAPLPSLSSDPGFAERAAKFSCFGSRSFNERTPAQLGLNSLRRSGSPLKGNAKLPRVSSTPSFRQGGMSVQNMNLGQEAPQMEMRGSGANSNEESSVSEQIPSGESGANSTRKRKAVSRGKPKEDGLALVKGHEDGSGKRSKQTENAAAKTEDLETKGGGGCSNDESEKQKSNNNNNQKPPEPPKDYIHVRARRGQATDSHSLAERVRREKISERMKLLQDIVPGCNKVTGKALMLDEIINYVQSLQRQVEFLSMKLATVNPEVDSNMDNLLTKDMFQQNANVPHQMYPPMDSSPPPPAFYNHHNPNMNSAQNQVDPLPIDAPLCRNNLGLQFHSLEGFNQFVAFAEDDLHSIVNQMGFGQNPGNFPVPNESSDMKVER